MIVVALCAGMGKRMNQLVPKPLVPFYDGTSMISRLCRECGPIARVLVLVIQSRHLSLFQKDLSEFPFLRFVFQEEQKGTGHAFKVAIDHLLIHQLLTPGENVVCLYGDTPLVPASLLTTLSKNPDKTQVVTCILEQPHGYGRILYEGNGTFRIVEEKDCTDKEKSIQCVNMGIYSFAGSDLLNVPLQFSTDNAQQEMYLTDYITLLQQNQRLVLLTPYPDFFWKLQGVNSMQDLKRLEHLYQQHQQSSI